MDKKEEEDIMKEYKSSEASGDQRAVEEQTVSFDKTVGQPSPRQLNDFAQSETDFHKRRSLAEQSSESNQLSRFKQDKLSRPISQDVLIDLQAPEVIFQNKPMYKKIMTKRESSIRANQNGDESLIQYKQQLKLITYSDKDSQ